MENKRNDYKLSLHWLNEQSLLFILYGKITHIPFKQLAVEIALGCKVMLRKFASKQDYKYTTSNHLCALSSCPLAQQ